MRSFRLTFLAVILLILTLIAIAPRHDVNIQSAPATTLLTAAEISHQIIGCLCG